jgi:UPF0755 protein
MHFRPLFAGLVLIAIGLAAAWFANLAYLSTPAAGEPISVAVRDGETASDVGARLAKARLIPSAAIYRAFAAIHASAKHPKAGTYAFRKGASLKLIADTIANGPEREIATLRIIEGETVREEAEALSGRGVSPAAFAALAGASPTRASSALPFDAALAEDLDVLKEIPSGQSLEGYLFPDTYEVWADDLPNGLIEKQLDAFKTKVVGPLDADRRASGMSWHDTLTLASIVEAEVQKPNDRRIVAGIFLNRIKQGMRIQSDATLNYVIDEGRSRATSDDLQYDSPYNTYLYDGLPPGPIGNPGFDAIDAAIHPSKTEYLYFLTDRDGNVLYAKTYDEHLRNKAKAYGE